MDSAHGEQLLGGKVSPLLLGELLRDSARVQSSPIKHRSSNVHIGWILLEWLALGQCIVSTTVVIRRLRIVLHLDINDVFQVVHTEELVQLAIAPLLHLPKLLLSPHVKAERSDHADVDAEAAMHT